MIVFPMAGTSSRFTNSGYTLPKYMLTAHGKTIFSHVVSGFSAYFENDFFLFITRDILGTPTFVESEIVNLGVKNYKIVVLDSLTCGQAETVAEGIARTNVNLQEPVTIFNIDTIRKGFCFPSRFSFLDVSGYLEVFCGNGANWSYVRLKDKTIDKVAETTEKIPISNLCCTGLYYFRSSELYIKAYSDFKRIAKNKMNIGELYIAPMYNLLIREGLDIRCNIIKKSEVIFCGVPDEYEAFKKMTVF